jgi:adenylate kinase
VTAAAACAQVPLGNGEVLILVGPPGSGKTEQAVRLSKKYKIPSVSLASVVTEHLRTGRDVPKALRASVAAGELLDDRTAIGLVGVRIDKPDAARGFILDGYPASEAQAKHLEQFIVLHKLQAPIVLVLDAPDEVVRQRMLKRRRADDTPENIERRIGEYRKERAFLEGWYTTQNFVTADSTGDQAQVFTRVEKALEAVFARRALKVRP